MNILLVGCSYNTAPIDLREKLDGRLSWRRVSG